LKGFQKLRVERLSILAMGRRGKMTPIINKIRITIGREVETFTLNRELLVSRSAAVKRVRKMRELAQVFLRDRGPFSGRLEPYTNEYMSLSHFPVEPNRIALDDLEFPSLDMGPAMFPADCDVLALQATEIGDPRRMDLDDVFGGST
jgi:hypothetical protein